MIIWAPRAEQCLTVLHALDRRELLMAEAAQLLGRSVRPARRLRAALRTRGLAALVHGNTGPPPAGAEASAPPLRPARRKYPRLARPPGSSPPPHRGHGRRHWRGPRRHLP